MRLFQRWRARYFRRFGAVRGCTLLLVVACVAVYRVSNLWSARSHLTELNSQRGGSTAQPNASPLSLGLDKDVFAEHFMEKFRFRPSHDDIGKANDNKISNSIGNKKTDLVRGKGSGRYPRVPDDRPEFFLPRNQTQFSIDAFPYRLRPADGLCEAPVDLAVIVLSAPGNRRQRQAVRDTWGSVVREGWQGGGWGDTSDLMMARDPGRVVVVFLLGHHHGQDALRKENEEHGDLLQWEGLADTYFNLTLKVLLGLRWVAHRCPKARYVMKVDDDTFVHVPRVLRRVFSLGRTDRIFGAFFKTDACKRDGKYEVSREAYPFELYPPHVKGNLYILPGDMVSRLVLIAPYLPYNNMEDAHVTGTLARALGVRHEPLLEREFSILLHSPHRCLFMNNVTLGSQQVHAALAYAIWATFSNSSLCPV